MAYLYFEDFRIGETARSTARIITQAEIIAFATQFDPQPMHTDPARAEQITGGLIASGWHTGSFTMRLYLDAMRAPFAPGTLGLGMESMRLRQPVRGGDALHVEAEVVRLRESMSRPEQGIVTHRINAINQRGQPVLEMTSSAIFPKRKDANQ